MIVFVELPEKGKSLNKDEKAAVVESTKAASDVYTPVSGEILENNQPIVDDPSNVNKDPENNGWFFKIKIKNKSELSVRVAEKLAKKAQEKKISKIYFDRGIYKYHGRVKIFAETLRKNGMEF